MTNKTRKLAIIGAGGHGKVILDAALLMGCWESVVFLDDSPKALLPSLLGINIIGGSDLLGSTIQADEYDLAIGIGDNHIRAKIFQAAKALGFHFPCIIHPSATISKFTEIGEGTVLFAHSVVNPASTIGKCVIINTSASVDHDSHLGDFVHISPGVRLGGGVQIGDFSWMGIGSCTRHEINIGSNCMIGAGAVVVKNILDNTTVIGNPATPFKRK